MTDLQELVDKQAIVEVVLRYCRGVDRLDFDAVRACYHDDGVDHHTGFDGDADAYVAWLKTLVPRFSGTMHLVGNRLVEVRGDVARSETYGIAHHWGEPPEDPTLNFNSGFRYVDRMERRHGQWKIAERWAVREWTRAVPAATVRPKEGVGPDPRRDRSDPVYLDWPPGTGVPVSTPTAGADPVTDDASLLAIYERCSNWGRWGPDDELGTLNYITPEVRLRAAACVRLGRSVSLSQDLSKHETPTNPRPIVHFMAYEDHSPRATIDFIGMVPHGLSLTHLDALGHCFFDGRLYNGRPAAETVSKSQGLLFASIMAQKEGIFTRGVLLDVTAARGAPWLAAGDYVTADDLDAAEALTGGRVASGDAVVVHMGLEARETVEGPEDRSLRAGLDAGAVAWLHDRQVSVYTGDCIERMPYPSEVMPVPLHQIGLVSMGLVLLDSPQLAPLVALSRSLHRPTFLLTCAALPIPGGTGCPVNPIAVF